MLEALDAVLLDDVYAPEFTLREILHTMEALSRRGVIVVAAAVVAPADWHDTIVEVGWPDEGARLEIARRLAAASSIGVSDAALRSLARRATGNPRELQSAIARLAAESLVARL